MAGPNHTAEDVDIDLGRLFSAVARQWARILLGALVIAALAFVLSWLATPKYKSEARILIRTGESEFTRPTSSTDRGNDANSALLDEAGVISQVEVIQSNEILLAVAAEKGLATEREFDPSRQSPLTTALVLLGVQRDPGEQTRDERLLRKIRENLSVYRIDRSRVIVVEFKSEKASIAASVADAIADQYLAATQTAKAEANKGATDWLKPEISNLTQRVREAEAKVADYRAQQDLLVGQNNSLMTTQQLSELTQELSRVRASRSRAESDAEGVRKALQGGASLDSIPEIMASPMIQRLRESEAQLKADIADLSTTLLENHPRIKSMRSQLADREAQTRKEAQNVLASLTTAAETARVREQQLVADVNKLKAESARAGGDEVQLRALEREAAAARDLLNSYLTRLREASSRAELKYMPVDAWKFSKALEPSLPYFPKVIPITGAAFGAGLLLMMIGVMLAELFSGRAMRPVEGARLVRAEPPVAPEPPPAAARTEAQAAPAPVPPKPVPVKMPSGFGEIGVTAAAERLISLGVSKVLFVSPEGDEAAASSVLVARAVADAGLKSLLVDLTASGAAAIPMLENARLSGITDLLASGAQFTDIIHADLYSDAHVIPSGTANPAVAMKAIERLPIVMNALVTAYDVVIVECGPADPAGLRRLAGDGADIMISVIEPHDKAVAQTVAAMKAAGFHAITLVSPEASQPAATGRSAA